MLSTLSARHRAIHAQTVHRARPPQHAAPWRAAERVAAASARADAAAAKAIFDEALAPHLAAGMIEELATQPIPYRQLDGPRAASLHARGLVDRREEGGALRFGVDLRGRRRHVRHLRRHLLELGVAEALRPYIDCDEGVRLYSSFYVVRSTCDAPNLHTDWGDAVGCNAFTLLAPLEDYTTADFQLLYQNGDRKGPLRQYTYKAGEAIVFSSKFVHSTEPGCAVDGSGRPHAFLCWTFGSDKEEHWVAIEPTIGGYQSRFMRTYDNKFKLTDIGRYLADKS